MAATYFRTPEQQRDAHNAVLAAQTASAARAARDPAYRAHKWVEHFRRLGDAAFNAELAKVLQAAEQAGYVWPYRSN